MIVFVLPFRNERRNVLVNLYPVFRQIGRGERAFLVSSSSQLCLAQRNPMPKWQSGTFWGSILLRHSKMGILVFGKDTAVSLKKAT